MEIRVAQEPSDKWIREIGKVKRAEFGWEDDHRVFGFCIDFTLSSGNGQSTGWLGLPPENVGEFLATLLAAAGCERWHQLVGKVVVTRHEDDGGKFIRGFEQLPIFDEPKSITFSEWWPE
jgi:hypothetical protein